MTTPPLFRDEARQALKVRLEGEVVAFTPPSVRRLSYVFGAVVVAAVAFASTATYTRYVPAIGQLAPLDGLVTVTAPLSGDLLSISAKQGDRVQAGQALALLRNNQVQADGSVALTQQRTLLASRKLLSADLKRAKDEEIELAIQAAQVRVAGVRRSLAAAQAVLESANHQVTVSRRYLEQQRELVKSGFLASAGVVSAERAFLGDMQQVRQAEQNIAAQHLELTNAEQAGIQARGQKGALAAQSADTSASLDIEASRLVSSGEAVISSTVAGTVAAVPALRGPVGAGTPLFVVVPDGPMYAHLMISEAAAYQAKQGQVVSLRVLSRNSNDSLKLAGVIETLAKAPIPSGREGEQGYLVRVKLDAESQKTQFPLGARVEARLQVESKTLLGWLFGPLVKGLRQTTLLSW
jgi:multidrug efflux pump subunit AcrA (membrane-fusion protein)